MQEGVEGEGGGDDGPIPMAWRWSMGAKKDFIWDGDRVCNTKGGTRQQLGQIDDELEAGTEGS